jgi:hypothetical protein
MNQLKMFRRIHFAGTIWFMLCSTYVLIKILRQAGVSWFFIFSLSGHSVLFVFLLVSLYLFAMFRGVSKSQTIEAEHPLTSSAYYAMFYVAAPFLGGLASCLGLLGVNRIDRFLLGVCLGTLGTTFLVWIIIDPLTGLLEMLLPSSRKCHSERLSQSRALRQKRQAYQKHLLTEISISAEQNILQWREILQPNAEKLAGLLLNNNIDFSQAEREAIDMGVSAWQMGGLSCMRQFHDMIMSIYRKKSEDSIIIDYVSTWWDGIGSWRTPSLI